MKRMPNLMKTWQVLPVVCIAFFTIGGINEIALAKEGDEKPFFYETNGRVFLDLLPETVGVKFVDGTTVDEVNQFADAHDSCPVTSHSYGVFWELTVPPGLCPKDFMTLLKQEDIVEFATPVYLIRSQRAILIDQFGVQFVPEMSDADIEAFNAKHHVEIVAKRPRPYGRFVYTLKVTQDSEFDALSMANFYHGQNFTLWAQPGFITYPLATAVKVTSRHLATTWAAIKRKVR